MKRPLLVRETSSCQMPSTSRPIVISTVAGLHLIIPAAGDRAAQREGGPRSGWTSDNRDARRGAMNDLSLTILAETAGDAPAIDRLNERTFGPGRYANTAYRLREQVAHRVDVSFTARTGTLLVGSVRLSPIRIGETRALLLGPLTVEPAFRERGVGQA